MPTRFLLLSLALCSSFLVAHGQVKPTKDKGITISSMPWMAMTSHSLSVEDIRSRPSYRVSVLAPWDVDRVLERLALLQMEATTEVPSDIRLVIDVHLDNGKRETYVANRFYLYSEITKRRWKMTPEFKRLFDFQEMELFK